MTSWNINYESPFSRQSTSGSDYQSAELNDQFKTGLLSEEEESEENLIIESLNKISSPSEEGPQWSEQNTQHSDYIHSDALLWMCQYDHHQSIDS